MILPQFVDERFLEHRRRSTSLAGIISAELALLLWGWRFFVHHVIDWNLAAVALTFIAVKLGMMFWYRRND